MFDEKILLSNPVGHAALTYGKVKSHKGGHAILKILKRMNIPQCSLGFTRTKETAKLACFFVTIHGDIHFQLPKSLFSEALRGARFLSV